MKQDVNTKYFDIINQINEQKRSAQANVANLIYRARQDAYDRAVKNATSGRASSSKIYNSISDLASNWVSGLSSPFDRPGGREAITRQIAAQYGGSPQDYAPSLPNGWESTAWTKPRVGSDSPQLKQDENGNWYIEEQ